MSIKDTTGGIQFGGDHYKGMKIQPIDYAEQNDLTPTEFSVVKYVSRHRNKNGVDDLKKAAHYVQMLVNQHYPGHKMEFEFKEEPVTSECNSTVELHFDPSPFTEMVDNIGKKPTCEITIKTEDPPLPLVHSDFEYKKDLNITKEGTLYMEALRNLAKKKEDKETYFDLPNDCTLYMDKKDNFTLAEDTIVYMFAKIERTESSEHNTVSLYIDNKHRDKSQRYVTLDQFKAKQKEGNAPYIVLYKSRKKASTEGPIPGHYESNYETEDSSGTIVMVPITIRALRSFLEPDGKLFTIRYCSNYKKKTRTVSEEPILSFYNKNGVTTFHFRYYNEQSVENDRVRFGILPTMHSTLRTYTNILDEILEASNNRELLRVRISVGEKELPLVKYIGVKSGRREMVVDLLQ